VQPGISTTDALAIAGLSMGAWRQAMNRGDYDAAPEAGPNDRSWDTDDIVVLCWFRILTDAVGVPRPAAGRAAGQLRAAMRISPNARRFRVYAIEHETSVELTFAADNEPPSDPRAQDPPAFTVDAALWRLKVRAAAEGLRHAR
jgi:hypothetical protein